jgi:hypothetical protein
VVAKENEMITYYEELIQGSDEWLAARCGLLTASEMKEIITPATLAPKSKKNPDELIDHAWELLAQRITGYVEPHYIGDDMLRGKEDEIEARILYSEIYAPVTDMGFIVKEINGFKIGYSPDGLVGEDGLIECKSRRQKFQIETILNNEMPDDYRIQVQTGMLVTGRAWCDFISYSAGLPMFVKRVFADTEIQTKILEAATIFEEKLAAKLEQYKPAAVGFFPTERRVEQEMTI